MAKAIPPRAMALTLTILAPAVAPDVSLVFAVTTSGTWSQGVSFPLTTHLDTVSVEPVVVDVEVFSMDESSVLVMVILLAAQGLAAFTSS
eukprot:CAMPEP_0181047118 /NCGR_PEP_ID=MMETSP1070-20121207/14706_1 /TAXON_ID=265543 /ORGANISM="Minutocellus polymorphus, Strain NH13" /LENGTH=89 /DNA_ID=CAMNT_0023125763 /DNA_START=146 /DNA_END=415 /DNA_ORIENTATION=+